METLGSPFLPGSVTLSAKELEHCGWAPGTKPRAPSEGHYGGYEQRGSCHCDNYCYFIFISSPSVYHIHLVLTRDGWGRRDQKSRQLLSSEPRGLNGRKVQRVDEQARQGAARGGPWERKRQGLSGQEPT